MLGHPLLWRGEDGGGAGLATIATGFASLDRYLPGGGWPLSGITEIFIEHYGLGELKVLMPALAALSRHAVASRRWIVWIAPPFVPYAPALARHGVALERILLVHPTTRQHQKKGSEPFFAGTDRPHTDSRDALWAVEQAIRSQSSLAVLAWVREADVPALRRLQLGAEFSHCWTVLFRPPAAISHGSPAALRFRLTAVATGAAADRSIDSPDGIEIDIQKCRGRRPQRFRLESR